MVRTPARPSHDSADELEVQRILAERVGALVRLLVVFRAFPLLLTVLTLDQFEAAPVLGLALVAAAVISYLPLAHWDRVGPAVLRHPSYLAAELLLATIILAFAGPESAFLYFTVASAAIAGLMYGGTGAVVFTGLMLCTYFGAIELRASSSVGSDPDLFLLLGLPALYPLAAGAGAFARRAAGRQLGAEVARERAERSALASAERHRLAREMHDSLAKTIEGIALEASSVPELCRASPEQAAAASETIAADARRASSEARALLSELRQERPGPVREALSALAEEWAERQGLALERSIAPESAADEQLRHELLRILAEALDNVRLHADASRVRVGLRVEGSSLVLGIENDGVGMGLEEGHADDRYGIVGMRERAEALGGRLEVGPSELGGAAVIATIPHVLSVARRIPADLDEAAPGRDGGRLGSRRGRRGGGEESSVIRVLIADDNEVVRRGLCSVLDADRGLEVVGQAGDGAEVIAAAKRLSPDVVILDVRMPGVDGIQAAQQLSRSHRVMILTYSDEEEILVEAIRAGARSYVVHGSLQPPQLRERVKQVAAGQVVLSREMVAAAFGAVRGGAERHAEDPSEALTERESEVTSLLKRGLANNAIASELQISEKTVKNHMTHIYEKLRVRKAIASLLGGSD